MPQPRRQKSKYRKYDQVFVSLSKEDRRAALSILHRLLFRLNAKATRQVGPLRGESRIK